MDSVIIRPAAPHDVAFLARTIVEAEKSGTDKLGLGAIFGIDEIELLPLICRMLEEDLDACDYSISAFLVAMLNDLPVAAVAGWVEQADNEPPSHRSRANLFGHILPQTDVQASRARRDIIAPLQIEREPLALQIEHVYVDPTCRGRSLAGSLIAEHERQALARWPDTMKVQVQVMANNAAAVRAYGKLGFSAVRTFRTDDPRVLSLLPWNERLLMEKATQPN